MSNNLSSIARYVETLVDDARSLIAATSGAAEDNVRIARARLDSAIDSGSEIYGRIRDEARDKAKYAGKYATETVRENPVTSLALVLVIGGLIALLLTRRRD